MVNKIKTDIPLVIIVILAALAIPRVVVHDLHMLPLDSPLYTALAVTPFAIWVLYAIFGKSKRPVYDFVVLGILFGLMLAVTHELTWNASWGDNIPHIHGNLEGKLDPFVESMLLRTAAFISSFGTGVVFGGATAFIAVAASKVRQQLKH